MKILRVLSIGVRLWGIGFCLLLWAAFAYAVLVYLPFISLKAWHQLVETSTVRYSIVGVGILYFTLVVPVATYYYGYAFGFRWHQIPFGQKTGAESA